MTLDELDNPNDLAMTLYLNGEVRQQSSTAKPITRWPNWCPGGRK